MKKFIVERIIPGAGILSEEECRMIAQRSCEVIAGFQSPYHWIQSFVTSDKIYCIHIAENEHIVREHAKLTHMPIHAVNEVIMMLDPLNSESI